MLFPDINPQYKTDADHNILKKMESFYSDSILINQSFWGEASIDTMFEAGDQTLYNEIYGNVPIRRRKNFNFNRIRRIVNMISGHQRRNRKSIIATPRDNASNKTADQLSKALLWTCNNDDILETISTSFHGALVTGLNLLQVWNDYSSDPVSGNIRVDNCSYNSFLIDPFFRKPDLSDCNGLWKRSYLTKSECIALIPDKKDEILNLPGTDQYGPKDGKFQYMPESYDYNNSRLVTYDEFYYRDFRPQTLVVDTVTGETMEWSGNEEALREYLRAYPQISTLEQQIPTVKTAIVVSGVVMYDGSNTLGIDRYPFVPVFGYYNPQLVDFQYRIQGVVRSLRDPQFIYNRRKLIELDILESQINSGYIYKENALVDPSDVFLQGQGKGLALKATANMTDIQPIVPPAIPPTTLQVSEIMGREIQEISGVNEELLGSADDDKAGILSMLRQGAGLTTLQPLFDQLDQSQKLLGNILIETIQNNFSVGKIKRVIQEEPTPEFFNKNFGKYDAVIEDGLNTSTQKQMQFAQMLHLREAGVPISTADLLDASTLQNKNKIMENAVKQEQQAAEMQQQRMNLEMAQIQSQIKLAEARAQADQGLGLERVSRVQENQALAVERRAEAEKDRELGVLHLVKAAKELEDMDINQLERIINLVKENSALENPEQPQENSI